MSEQKVLLPELTKDLSPVHQGWLKLADHKQFTFDSLAKSELVVQGFILNIEQEKDWAKCKERLAQAKAAAAESKDQRLQFTRLIDEKLCKPAMEFEKRNDELIKKAEAHELKLRIEENKKANEVGEKIREENEFKAHFTNEFFQIAAEYRAELKNLILHYYKVAIEQKLRSAKALKEFKDGIIPILKAVTPRFPNKFNRQLMTPERAKELYAEIRPYDSASDLEAAIKDFDQVFGMYFEDLKNAEAAVKRMEEETKAANEKEEKQVAAEVAINNVIASADVKLDGPTVKVKVEVVVEDTEACALAIIKASLQNWPSIKENLKTKKWSNLSVTNLANALSAHITATGEKFAGVNIREVIR